jgi:hypothetical protein
MNDKLNNLNQPELEPRELEPSELEVTTPEDVSWANFLSSAASDSQLQTINDDEAVIARTLGFLKRERNEPLSSYSTSDPVWATRLSSAAQLRAVDHEATKVVLAGLQHERIRSRRAHVIQLGTRWLAGTGLVAAVIVGVLLRTPTVSIADSSEAYQAYQEASEGW